MVRRTIKSGIPVLLMIIISAVGGCKIGPNYKRPSYDIGTNYRFALQADTMCFADTSWAYLFTDPVLKALIKTGLENNFDLKIAYEKVNQARASFKQVRAEIWPSLGAQGTAEYIKSQVPTHGTVDYHDFYAVGNLSWEIDLWGKLRRSKESARAQLLSAEAYRRSVYISLIAEIANSYFQLVELEDEVQITRENVKIREEALNLVRSKLIAGTVSGLVVAQAEAELAQINTQLPAIEKAIGAQESSLQLLIGKLPGTVSTGDSLIRQINEGIIPKAGIPSRLILRRPDLIAAEQQLVSANAQIGVARGMMLPSLSLNASAGYSQLGSGIIGNAVGNLVAPIFSFGKLRANVVKAKAQKEEMLLTYQKSIYTAIKEVSDGILAVDKQKTIVDENKNLVMAAQTAFDLSNQLFSSGYASYLDVLDAQRLLYNAQISQTRSFNSALSSVVSLYLALGGGWR